MLQKFTVCDFRVFNKLEIDFFQQTTLLCGLNGTGKSSLVVALSRLQGFICRNLAAPGLVEMEDIPVGLKEDKKDINTGFQLNIASTSGTFVYSVIIRHDENVFKGYVKYESLKVDEELVYENHAGEAWVMADEQNKRAFPVDIYASALGIAARYNKFVGQFISEIEQKLFVISVNTAKMKDFHEKSSNFLELDAANFTAWYDMITDRNVVAIGKAIPDIKPIIPNLSQFSLQQTIKGKRLFADLLIGNEIRHLPFRKLSDGQKILAVYYLLIHAAPENSMIIIDEFENFLAFREMQPLLDTMQDLWEEKRLQMILVSHNDKTINWFADSAILFKTHYSTKDESFSVTAKQDPDPLTAMQDL